MPRQLTAASTLENLKKEAKRWLKAIRAKDAAAVTRLQRAHVDSPAEPALRDIQYALAREHGVEGWTALTRKLASQTPSDETATLIKPDELSDRPPIRSMGESWIRCVGCGRCRTPWRRSRTASIARTRPKPGALFGACSLCRARGTFGGITSVGRSGR